MKKYNKKQLLNRKSYQEAKQSVDKQSEAGLRTLEKERGRRLDIFYNWSIIIVAIAIVLVFVLAFVI